MAQRYKDRRTLPTHAKCAAHSGYLMDCEEFERLIAKTGQRCTLCAIPAAETPHGILHIDHDQLKGSQAVRGLLCAKCNAAMRHIDSGHRKPDTKQARYLKHPWYFTQLTPEQREWWRNRPAIGGTRSVHRPGGSRRGSVYWTQLQAEKERKQRINDEYWAVREAMERQTTQGPS